MPHQIDDVLRIVFHRQFARFEPFAEPSRDVGHAGVCCVAVDVGFDAAVADEQIPVTAGGTAEAGEIGKSLSQDFIHGCIRFAVSREAAQGNVVTTVDILRNSVM